MKRKLFIGMLLLAVLLCFASCKEEKTKDDIKNQQSEKEDDTPGGNQGQEKEPTSPEETGDPDDPPADPSLKTITGITFTDFSTVFDDMPHRLEITGTLPDGVTVRYTGNEATEPGVYAATATLSGEGYNTLVLRASLTIRKKTITGVTFPDSTVVYDGTSHAVTVKGNLPQGVSVSYNQNQAKNAGTYRAVATLSGRGYETLTLSAALTIEKANITGITLADDTVLYDGKAHSIQVVGNVPAGVTCTYQYNSETLSGVAGAGDYTVVATLSGSNHKTLTLTATLKIISFSEDELTCQYYKGKVYFQNPLDKDRLYAYTVSGGKLEKVNNDKPAFFTEAGGKLYYTSKGLLSSTMKEISSAGISEVAAFSGEYLVSDGTYLYFALNPLIDLKDTAGIYRYKLGENEDPERLYAGKAGWLTLYQNYIYFTDGANKGVLRRISKNGGTASLVYDETVSDVTLNGSYLYFNQYSLLGNAIYRYSLSGGKASKITVDSGKNLTVIGNYLYYINHDLLTGKVFGDGIYRVSLTGTLGLPGSKVVEGKVCSLQSDGDTLFYYTVAAKHLFAYSVSTQTATDLMQSFTPIENDIISGYEESKVYKGEIYFINPKDKDALYKYNPQTFASFKVIATACSDFYFDDGYIYYSSYILTNYALFRVKEDGSAPAEKISRDRCDSLVFDGDDIYYINNGVTSNAVYRMKKDGTNPTKLWGGTDGNVHFLSLAKSGNTLYFCTNPYIGYKKFCSLSIPGSDVNKITEGEQFVQSGTTVYFYDQKAKKLRSFDTRTERTSDLLSDVEINDMILSDGKLYFSSEKAGKTGLYRYTPGGSAEKLTDYAVTGISVLNGNIYFFKSAVSYVEDYPVLSQEADGKLYCLSGKTAKAID